MDFRLWPFAARFSFSAVLGFGMVISSCAKQSDGTAPNSQNEANATADKDLIAPVGSKADQIEGSQTNPSAIAPPTSLKKVEYAPLEIATVFRNPDKGWIAYDFTPIENPGKAEMVPAISTVYTNYLSWGDLEPYEGQYRWDIIDRVLNAYPHQKVKIGIVLADPTSRPWCGASGMGQTPNWLIKRLSPTQGALQGRWITKFPGFLAVKSSPKCGPGEGAIFEPHYWSENFQTAHSNFVWALARRYYDNSESAAKYGGAPDWATRISTIDLSTYGMWGEWHSDVSWPSMEVKRSSLRYMVTHYFESFSKFAVDFKKDAPELEISTVGSTIGPDNDIFASGDPSQVKYAVVEAANANAITSGMVRKFLGADPKHYFKSDERSLIEQNISKSPFRLEWGSCSGEISEKAFGCLEGSPQTVDEAVDFALKNGANSIGWFSNRKTDSFPLSDKKKGSDLSILDYFQHNSGYRFFVSKFSYMNQVSRGETFSLDQIWHQRAFGKLYRKHYIGAFLQRGGTVIPLGVSDTLPAHTWAVGPVDSKKITSSFDIPIGIEPGWYVLKFAVVDRLGRPAMNLAISKKEIDDVHLYAKYDIGEIWVK